MSNIFLMLSERMCRELYDNSFKPKSEFVKCSIAIYDLTSTDSTVRNSTSILEFSCECYEDILNKLDSEWPEGGLCRLNKHSKIAVTISRVDLNFMSVCSCFVGSSYIPECIALGITNLIYLCTHSYIVDEVISLPETKYIELDEQPYSSINPCFLYGVEVSFESKLKHEHETEPLISLSSIKAIVACFARYYNTSVSVSEEILNGLKDLLKLATKEQLHSFTGFDKYHLEKILGEFK